MLTIAQREYLTLAILLIVFIAFLVPSLLTTRAEVRDGLRKQEITRLKRSLEDYYNIHESYPLTFDASPYRYVVTGQDESGATGYYLEAQFEVEQKNQAAFDEDESRKFHYRILHQENKILYRVCGGSELQCQE
ncbi:MAG: hypothetical protein ABIH36_01775 [bacterium]